MFKKEKPWEGFGMAATWDSSAAGTGWGWGEKVEFPHEHRTDVAAVMTGRKVLGKQGKRHYTSLS